MGVSEPDTYVLKVLALERRAARTLMRTIVRLAQDGDVIHSD